MMSIPTLPSKAAYLHLLNPTRRNALSVSILRSLRSQLHAHLTSPVSNAPLLLPEHNPSILESFGKQELDPKYGWLSDASAWHAHRSNLPNVIVLRSEGAVFSSGHDLKEIESLSDTEVKETFAICAEVMKLIRQSPAIVVACVQGLATAAGAQLALTADVTIAHQLALFQLPGASIGLPCTSPVTALSRRVSSAQAFRMLALAEPVRGQDMQGAVDVAVPKEGETADEAFERRIGDVVDRLANTAGQPAALGKWAFWTQLGFKRYEEAAAWAGKVMALHARSEDAQSGIGAFLRKEKTEWVT